jgi:hypothetical protein
MSHRNEPGRPAQAGAGSGQGDGHPIKSRKHKVVIESVTQEKKKLRIVVSRYTSYGALTTKMQTGCSSVLLPGPRLATHSYQRVIRSSQLLSKSSRAKATIKYMPSP